jgi:4-amino-4-deoxy-L-arabinose transferase-like glycosyltransferase
VSETVGYVVSDPSTPDAVETSNGAERVGTVARGAIIAAAAWMIVIFVAVALRRLNYRAELEWLEGGSVQHVARVLHGHSLYTAPSVRFVDYGYPPVYYWVSAVVAKVFGLGFPALRLVSLTATLCTLGGLFWFVRRETQETYAGAIAAGTYASAYAAVDGFFDTARVDALAVAFVLAALIVLRYSRHARSFTAAGAVMGVAFLTKQTAAPIAVALLVYLVIARRAAVGWYLLGLLATIGATSLALDLQSHGWYRYFVFELYTEHALVRQEVTRFWTRDLLQNLPFASLLVVVWLIASLVDRRRADPHAGLYGAALVGALVSSWVSKMHTGGAPNSDMPAFVLISLCAGIGAARLAAVARGNDRLASWRPLLQVAFAALVVVQLGSHTLQTFHQEPRPGGEAALGNLTATLAAAPGAVYVPYHTWYPALAGKQTYANAIASIDVLRSHNNAARRATETSIDDAIRGHQFSLIIEDEQPSRTIIDAGYRCERTFAWTRLKPVDGFIGPRWSCVLPALRR